MKTTKQDIIDIGNKLLKFIDEDTAHSHFCSKQAKTKMPCTCGLVDLLNIWRNIIRVKVTYDVDWRSKNWLLNVYICKNSHKTCTVYVDEGITPFTIGCRNPICDESAQSAMYPTDRPVPMTISEPTHEWYKPNILNVAGIDKEHVEMGGLLLRKRTNATPVEHKILESK